MSYANFFEMLEREPKLKHLWDKENKTLLENDFAAALGVMSSGEVYLAQFFASVWFGNNQRYGFDFVSAIGKLDSDKRLIIAEWLKNPFWP
ncbi:MAG: hypothetical protein HOO93_05510 [Methyloglobulus sp.]|uniref:hypothetical protein n=1 Tax=Methyloglobulus sp. TaxID=2518622 RepID=UPI0018447518|nr:hypothetical protein [Methyloglobulus sp.]